MDKEDANEEKLIQEQREIRRNKLRNKTAEKERLKLLSEESIFSHELCHKLRSNLSNYIDLSTEEYETRFEEVAALCREWRLNLVDPGDIQARDAHLRAMFDEYMSRSIEELKRPEFGDRLNALYGTAEKQKKLLSMDETLYVQVCNLLITGQPENSATIIEAWAKRKKIGFLKITGLDLSNALAEGVPLITILSPLDTCPEEESFLFIDGLNRASRRAQDALLRIIQKKKMFDPSLEHAEHNFSKMLFTIATLNPTSGGENCEVIEPGQAMYTSFMHVSLKELDN